MKQFLSKYSYKMVSVFVYQFAISIFGNVLSLALVKNTILSIIVSILTILFNLFLIYTSIWDVGSKDKPSIDAGRITANPYTGLYIALGSYIPMYIITAVYAVLLPVATKMEGTLTTICAYAKMALFLLNGSYTGILSIQIREQYLNNFWWMYFVVSIPTIVVCTVAYILGTKGVHFTKLMIAPTPEEVEIKREKKLERKNKN